MTNYIVYSPIVNKEKEKVLEAKDPNVRNCRIKVPTPAYVKL